MSAHTEGPWLIYRDADDANMVRIHPAVWRGEPNDERRYALIASVSPWDGDKENADVIAEAEANACLIAAAPDLLEALQLLVRCCDMSTRPEHCADTVRAALTKAAPEQQEQSK